MKRTNKIKSVGLIAIVGLVAGIYFLVFMPYRANIQQAKDEVIYQAEANERLYADNQTLKSFAALVPAANVYDTQLMKRFPPTSDAQTLRAALMEKAAANNITGLSITLTVPEVVKAPTPDVQTEIMPEDVTADLTADPTAEAPVSPPTAPVADASALAYQIATMTGEGSMDDVAKFLKDLESIERALVVTNLTVSNSTTGSSFNATAYTYLHAPTLLPEETGDSQEAIAPTPGIDTEPAIAP